MQDLQTSSRPCPCSSRTDHIQVLLGARDGYIDYIWWARSPLTSPLLASFRRTQQQDDRVRLSALERVDRAYTITAPLIQLYAERPQQISFTVETPTHVLLYDLEWCDDKYVRICNA